MGRRRRPWLFVTAGASIPLGPGQVIQNGTAFWALSTAQFPEGFSGPVTYGLLPDGAADITEENLAVPVVKCLSGATPFMLCRSF